VCRGGCRTARACIVRARVWATRGVPRPVVRVPPRLALTTCVRHPESLRTVTAIVSDSHQRTSHIGAENARRPDTPTVQCMCPAIACHARSAPRSRAASRGLRRGTYENAATLKWLALHSMRTQRVPAMDVSEQTPVGARRPSTCDDAHALHHLPLPALLLHLIVCCAGAGAEDAQPRGVARVETDGERRQQRRPPHHGCSDRRILLISRELVEAGRSELQAPGARGVRIWLRAPRPPAVWSCLTTRTQMWMTCATRSMKLKPHLLPQDPCAHDQPSRVVLLLPTTRSIRTKSQRRHALPGHRADSQHEGIHACHRACWRASRNIREQRPVKLHRPSIRLAPERNFSMAEGARRSHRRLDDPRRQPRGAECSQRRLLPSEH
jgi:hypothetical protein